MPSESPPPVPPAPLSGHLHPLALVFNIVSLVRGFLIPAIPLLFLGRRSQWGWILATLALISLARALMRYYSFTYRVENGELITREGVIGRTERHIRLERVQEVRIEQGVFHRLFGVVEAKVETGGGGGPEATFPVLARADAEALRAAVFAKVDSPQVESPGGELPAAPAGAPPPELLRRLSLRDLILAGLTSNHLVSAFLLIGAVWAFIDDLVPNSIYERIVIAISGAVGAAAHEDIRTATLLAILTFVAFIFVGMLISVIGSVVVFYGFTLARRGEDLHRHYGLLTRRASSLPRRRIQVLAIEEGLLRRLFGLAALRVETVGARDEDDAERREGRDLLLPVTRRNDLDELLRVVFPDLDTSEWRRVSPLAIRRGMTKVIVIVLLMTITLSVGFGTWLWFSLLLLIPFSYLIIKRRYENLGYALGERYLRARHGWLGRLTQVVPIRKAQVLEIHETPFDRRLGLATLVIDTAGQSQTRGGPHVGNLPREEAYRLARLLARQAATTEYRL